MQPDGDAYYYRRREQAERRRAEAALDPQAARVHIDLADLYAERRWAARPGGRPADPLATGG